MDSDSSNLLLLLLLALFFVLFSIAILIEASLASVQQERAQWLVSNGARGSRNLERLFLAFKGPAGGVSLLKFILMASTILSGAALVVAGDSQWWVNVLLSVALLAMLGIAHVSASAVGQVFGERTALRTAGLVRGLTWMLRPLLSLEAASARRVSEWQGEQPDSTGDSILSVEAGGEPLDEREAQMIRGVVRLDQTVAREIMVPRVDMVVTELGTPLAEIAEQMLSAGHSRIPVYEESLDRIVGVAYARDILRHLSSDDRSPATLTASAVRPALFIPESKPLGELLDEFQEKRVHMAIVVDEYGGVSGIVTIEDLLEEIVGEIRDEFDVGEIEVESVGENEFLMDARIGIEQINELLGVDVEGDGFDTLGGFVYHRLGKIPSLGDTVEYDGLKIEVLSTVGRRLKRLRVIRTSQ